MKTTLTNPAYSSSLRLFCLIVLLIGGRAAARTPGTGVLTFAETRNDINYTSKCEFVQQDVHLVMHKHTNVTIHLTGHLDHDEVLVFVQKKNVVELPENITVESGSINETISLTLMAETVGHSVLSAKAIPENMTDVSRAFVRISVSHLEELDYMSDVVGWLYFVAWSVSFYPQTYSNWKRKSVIGLHFDFLALNILGFFVYSLFNVCLYWIPTIEQQYFAKHPHGVNPVQLNDVIFSLHAFVACGLQVIQCCIYDRGDQQVSKTARYIVFLLCLSSLVALILGASLAIQWLDFLYFMSYVKLFITLIKYIPQAYYNYRRKSTSGWSIGNILLDFTGGSLSIAQMFIIAYNYDDWGSLFGDPTKFGLGFFSIVFDVFFMVQHYILYRGNDNYLRVIEAEQRNSLTSSVSSIDYGSTGSH